MPRSKRTPRFLLSSSRGLLNQLFRFYLWENFRIRADFWKGRKEKLNSRDVLLHNGNQSLSKIQPGSMRLVVFQSEWNAADRLLWTTKGATHFLNLSNPISEIHKNIQLLKKTAD